MSQFNLLDFYRDLARSIFPMDVVNLCGSYGEDNEFQEIIEAVERLYENGASIEELGLRRSEAWMLYLAFVAKVERNSAFLQCRTLAVRACILVYVTRTALRRQCPILLPRWYDMGHEVEGDHINPSIRVGNLWSPNFLAPHHAWDYLEMCPNRDHVLSFRRPWQEFEDLQRPQLRNGRLMMMYPLTTREKRGQKIWRGRRERAHDGFATRIARNVMIHYEDEEELKSD